MSWYRILLNNDQVIAGHLMAIQTEFTRLISQTGTPLKGAALFAGEERVYSNNPRDLGHLPLYFSPESIALCSQLIASYSGAPSDRPDVTASLSLLVGWDQEARKLLE